jgi:transcription-repair coupling factor (superfamily II helicase)
LVPTNFGLPTLPHFTERLKDMPVSIGYLNRFRTPNKSRDLKDLAEGKLDIVIGTHQLVNKMWFLKI